MKIGIVTVFKSDNCGSFLQAWALGEKLSELGHDVYFCNYKVPLRARINDISVIIKCCLRFKFKTVLSRLKKISQFRHIQKSLKRMPCDADEADMYLIGSDTLWNFNDSFFFENADFFTGAKFNKPCYTYAISVGSTGADVISGNEKIVESIEKFNKIAVRDEYTKEVLSSFYPKENIISTVDPTLLFDRDTYIEKFSVKPTVGKKSLVIYHFGIISADMRAKLDDFARAKDLDIVEVGVGTNKSDVSVIQSPKNFITAFAGADYVFTNTFHGCVFSTLFNKQFATDGIYKKKVESFLSEFSLLDRAVLNAEDLERVMTAPVDYASVNELIKNSRSSSVAYLDGIIREVSHNE